MLLIQNETIEKKQGIFGTGYISACALLRSDFIRHLLRVRRYEVGTKEVRRKFLPPKSDVAFKELMRNETVRRHFISDVLEIPLEEIREVRLENTFLSRRGRREKEGILDVRLLLNSDRRINIELQIREVPAWDKRSLFYLSKMYSEGAHAGEDYGRLQKCIVICVLGFKWDAKPGYHKVYYLRDQEGQLYSDQFEIHVIELNKELTGDRLDDWISLFRVESMEELKMIRNTNPGIVEAVREVVEMNLGRRLRALYEEHMRIKRDRLYLRNIAIAEGLAEGLEEGRAKGLAEGLEEGRVKGLAEGLEEGRAEGHAQGLAEGRAQGTIDSVRKMLTKGYACEEISDVLEIGIEEVKRIQDEQERSV